MLHFTWGECLQSALTLRGTKKKKDSEACTIVPHLPREPTPQRGKLTEKTMQVTKECSNPHSPIGVTGGESWETYEIIATACCLHSLLYI